jgi:hypothetical protein
MKHLHSDATFKVYRLVDGVVYEEFNAYTAGAVLDYCKNTLYRYNSIRDTSYYLLVNNHIVTLAQFVLDQAFAKYAHMEPVKQVPEETEADRAEAHGFHPSDHAESDEELIERVMAADNAVHNPNNEGSINTWSWTMLKKDTQWARLLLALVAEARLQAPERDDPHGMPEGLPVESHTVDEGNDPDYVPPFVVDKWKAPDDDLPF